MIAQKASNVASALAAANERILGMLHEATGSGSPANGREVAEPRSTLCLVDSVNCSESRVKELHAGLDQIEELLFGKGVPKPIHDAPVPLGASMHQGGILSRQRLS